MTHLLLFKNCGCQNYSFATLLDSSPQEQSTKVLLHGARADVELGRDFLVAAALHQQLQYILIAARDFDLFQVQHASLLERLRYQVARSIIYEARSSPKLLSRAQL